MAEIIDLTYALSPDTVMYPGLPQPSFEQFFTVESEGANVTQITFVSHAGTHIDAPTHVCEDGATVDALPLDRLIGEATVVDLSAREEPNVITREDLAAHDASIRAGDILLLITGIYRAYGTAAYNDACPALAKHAAEWLVGKGISAYATDATSIERPGSTGNPMHRILLGAGIPIIENLANVERLTTGRIRLVALPMKLAGLDGGPCRVVALR